MKDILLSFTPPTGDWLLGLDYVHYNEMTQIGDAEPVTEIVSVFSIGLLLIRFDFILN